MAEPETTAGKPTIAEDPKGTAGNGAMVDPKSVARKPENEAKLKEEEQPAGDPTKDIESEILDFHKFMTGRAKLDESLTPQEVFRYVALDIVSQAKWKEKRFGRDVSDPSSPYAGINLNYNESTSCDEATNMANAVIKVSKRGDRDEELEESKKRQKKEE